MLAGEGDAYVPGLDSPAGAGSGGPAVAFSGESPVWRKLPTLRRDSLRHFVWHCRPFAKKQLKTVCSLRRRQHSRMPRYSITSGL